MRTRYVWRDGELQLVSANFRQNARSWQVMSDIDPYTSQIDGSTITSRSKHRAHLQAHGMIEVGNEKQSWTPPSTPPGLKEVIKDLVNERLRY